MLFYVEKKQKRKNFKALGSPGNRGGNSRGNCLCSDFNRGFPKIDHSGRSARIVLEQNKFSKKLHLKGIEPATLGL